MMNTVSRRGLLALVIPALALACQGTGGDDPAEIDRALGERYGDLDTGDEEREFGDPAFAEEDLREDDDGSRGAERASDRGRDEPGAAEDPAASHVRVLVTWGLMPPRRDARETIDWSGSVSVSNAALRVIRTVHFERDDHVVRPRADRSAVEFVSHTRPASDGLLLDIVQSPRLAPEGAPVTLTFSSLPVTHRLEIEPGMPRSHVVDVGEAGHQLSFRVLPPEEAGCERGAMSGRFTRVGRADGRAVGTMHGRLTSSDGRPAGVLRGLWGERRGGAQVFFAKVIDRDGRFVGTLAGHYRDGRFAGEYLAGGDRRAAGTVHGRYWEGAREEGGGSFTGQWSLGCEDAPDEGRAPERDGEGEREEERASETPRA